MQAYKKWPVWRVGLPTADFLSGLSGSILKLCIRFVYIKLGGVASLVAESKVKYPTPTPTPAFPKFPTPTPDSDALT